MSPKSVMGDPGVCMTARSLASEGHLKFSRTLMAASDLQSGVERLFRLRLGSGGVLRVYERLNFGEIGFG